MQNTDEPVVTVTDLCIDIVGREGDARVVHDLSFELMPGQILGIVGESGSGKSLTALALMRLLRPPVRASSGSIVVDGIKVLDLDERGLRRFRGRNIAMIYQNPMSSFNPVMTVGDQIIEAIRIHSSVSRREAAERAVQLLREVGIDRPEDRLSAYPSELSGGMLQRASIAMAICCDPAVLIADEATTALDVSTQAKVLELLKHLIKTRNMAVIFITHDLGVAAEFCDRIQVMYAGRIVEGAPATSLFDQPNHPYTVGLLGSLCSLEIDVDTPLPTIEGQPPIAGRAPSGCAYRTRCPFAVAECELHVPPFVRVRESRVACVRAGEDFTAGVLA